jgi:probable H4MPT-linked C1 transfer pathway protein
MTGMMSSGAISLDELTSSAEWSNAIGQPVLPRPSIGWDLGGVHVKAALVVAGRVRAVVQAPCALWRGIGALDESWAALPGWCRAPAHHVVTMTGELTDCFADRASGVEALSEWAASRLQGNVRIYAGRSGLIAPAAAGAAALDVASANWHATAGLVGRSEPEALLVDIGSTTADLIPIVGGRSASLAYTDAERLETGELVYTGVVRTPVLALARRAPFRGRSIALMAETFATSADIHRLTGALPEAADQQETADGQGKSTAETETRLARMIGRDRQDGTMADWRRLAAYFAERQLVQLHEAAAQVLSQGSLPPQAPLVGCGAGRFAARHLAGRLGRPYRDLADLVPLEDASAEWASSCAPAVALALLASA